MDEKILKFEIGFRKLQGIIGKKLMNNGIFVLKLRNFGFKNYIRIVISFFFKNKSILEDKVLEIIFQ